MVNVLLMALIPDSQYQRNHANMLRRKMMNGGTGGGIGGSVHEGQLNRIRNMNGMSVGPGGITLTESNPNYEFGGGTFTLQDLNEIPRENLRLVK